MLRGEFREDLYYRLKVIEVTVPPLRERRDEIPHLTRLLHRSLRAALQPAGAPAVATSCSELFLTYEWPGNIRELENMIKRIVILQDEQLVVREMSRAPRQMPAYASARRRRRRARRRRDRRRAGRLRGRRPSDDEPEPEVPLRTAPAGSRLADVAQAGRARRPSARSSKTRCARCTGTAAAPPSSSASATRPCSTRSRNAGSAARNWSARAQLQHWHHAEAT